jgi:hypothetical protein
MSPEEVRLRILELAMEHALSTDKLQAAREFEAFVFNRPERIPDCATEGRTIVAEEGETTEEATKRAVLRPVREISAREREYLRNLNVNA